MLQRWLVAAERVPCRMGFWSQIMSTPVLSKCAVQPASQSCPTERRDVVPRAGNTCAWQASGGRPGKSKSACVVDCMVLLLATVTDNGLVG